MNINQPLLEGTRLRYTGKAFRDFDHSDPFVVFLGYDSGSFCDLWVSYQNKVMCVCVADVETIELTNEFSESLSYSRFVKPLDEKE